MHCFIQYGDPLWLLWCTWRYDLKGYIGQCSIGSIMHSYDFVQKDAFGMIMETGALNQVFPSPQAVDRNGWQRFSVYLDLPTIEQTVGRNGLLGQENILKCYGISSFRGP